MEQRDNLTEKLIRFEMLLRRAQHGEGGGPGRGQRRVLALLKLQPETRQKDLAYLLGIRQQSLGELLAKLEQKGLITRTPCEDDRRATVIRLTDAGREAAEQGEREDAPDAFAALDEGERAAFEAALDKLIAAMGAQYGDVEPPRRPAGFGPHGWGPAGPGPGFAHGPGHGMGHGCHGHGHHGHGRHGGHGGGCHHQHGPHPGDTGGPGTDEGEPV